MIGTRPFGQYTEIRSSNLKTKGTLNWQFAVSELISTDIRYISLKISTLNHKYSDPNDLFRVCNDRIILSIALLCKFLFVCVLFYSFIVRVFVSLVGLLLKAIKSLFSTQKIALNPL